MPFGVSQGALGAYFNLPEELFGKSIQRSWQFFAFFIDNWFSSIRAETGPMPIIDPYHILSVTIPNYTFQKENVFYGQVPRSFPVLNLTEGLEVTVVFEEDTFGTVAYFINWMQKNIIGKDGLYKNPFNTRIGEFVVEIDDNMGVPVLFHIFHGLYFLDAGNTTYDYNSNDSIKYTVRFGVDTMTTTFTKYGVVSLGQQGIAATGRAIIGL